MGSAHWGRRGSEVGEWTSQEKADALFPCTHQVLAPARAMACRRVRLAPLAGALMASALLVLALGPAFGTGAAVPMASAAAKAAFGDTTPLDEYLAKPDDAYSWAQFGTPSRQGAVTVYNLNMTSQRWLSAAETSCHLWQHWLTVFVVSMESRVAVSRAIAGFRCRRLSFFTLK